MIDTVMRRVCAAAAKALYQYADSSGEGPWDMPEYLMPASAMNHIGSEITMTLETSFSKLAEWNSNVRERHGMSRLPDEEIFLGALALEMGSPRIDMVIYNGGNDRLKSEQEFLVLVEWKRGELSTRDRIKLLKILQHIDTCPFGAVCGFVETRDLDSLAVIAERDGDRWYHAAVPALPYGIRGDYAVCARVFDRPC